MELVDKWTAEGKITDANKDTLDTYWTHFEGYIHPQTNQLLAVVELKRTISRELEFRGLSHKSFEVSGKMLVTQGPTKDKVLRDNIISGLASDKIQAKIVKEGHEVTLNRVMEIARLEVSTTATPRQDARDCKS